MKMVWPIIFGIATWLVVYLVVLAAMQVAQITMLQRTAPPMAGALVGLLAWHRFRQRG